jgi:ubiquinone biosynthesis protein Coq4
MNRKQLLSYPSDTFAYHLGDFLHQHHFELIPKVESHDAYHALTGYGIRVEDEIALQYLCFGNGKRSMYLYGAIVLGTVLLPEYIDYYTKSYSIGKRAVPFHHLNFQSLLDSSYSALKTSIFNDDLANLHPIQSINNTL